MDIETIGKPKSDLVGGTFHGIHNFVSCAYTAGRVRAISAHSKRGRRVHEPSEQDNARNPFSNFYIHLTLLVFFFAVIPQEHWSAPEACAIRATARIARFLTDRSLLHP
jgi:hypothetical protein